LVKKDVNTGISYSKIGNLNSPITLLFIHGSGCNATLFEPIAKELNNFNCIVVDLPGHGLSNIDTCKSIFEYGEVLSQFIKNIDSDITEKLICVGHSMGGCIALLLGLDKTIKKMHKIVVISSGAKVDMDEDFLNNLNNNKLDKLFLLKCSGSLLNYRTLQFFATKTEKDSVMINDLKTSIGFDIRDELKNISLPTLILMGDKDILIGVECAEFLKSEISTSQIKYYNNIAHLLPVVKFKDVAKDIDSFIKNN